MIVTNLKQLKPVESTLVLKHAETKEVLKGVDKKPLTFRLVSLESQHFFANAVMQTKLELDVTEEQKKDPLYHRMNSARYLAGNVTGWSHPEVFGDFSFERAVELFDDVELEWLVTQVQQHVTERKHFFVK